MTGQTTLTTRSAGMAVTMLVVVLGACSSGSASAPRPTAPLGHGPAISRLSFTGAESVTGPITKVQVSCSFPSYDGPVINLFGSPPTAGQSTTINLSPGKVHVRLDEGSGATHHARDFEGTGITGFDATRGARIDSPVKETTTGGSEGKGKLGAITSIKGTVSCGAQSPGSSTVKITGDAGSGPIDDAPKQVRVNCSSGVQGKSATIFAVTKAGTTPTFLVINARVDAFTVSVSTRAAFAGFFSGRGKGTSAPTSRGVHIDGDAVLAGGSGGEPRTLHLVGDATCSTSG